MDEPLTPNSSHERSARDSADSDAALDGLLRSALIGELPGFDAEAHYRRIREEIAGARHRRRWRDGWARWREALARPWVPAVSFGLGAACAAVLILALRVSLPGPSAVVEPLGQAQPGGLPAGVVLQVRFRDDIALSTLRAALRAADAEVIGGPGALGIWRIRVPSETAQRSLRVLAADPSVLEVRAEP